MITPQHVVNVVLDEAAKLGGADETMVLVTDKVEATLRWAGNSMTTNGVSVSRSVTVISVVRRGSDARIGTVVSAEADPRVLPGLVAASQQAAASAPEAGDAAPLLADAGEPADWDAPVPGTGPLIFADLADSLGRGFRGTDRLYGFAHHSVSTTFVATSTGLRRRFTQPTGRWRSTPSAATPAHGRVWGHPTSSMCQPIRCSSNCRRGWAGRGAAWSCRRGVTRRSCRRRRWPT